ncbi:MAG: hypothetical protein FWD57_06825, partial [Polyangiaceae bacterium]|nr:hypothetical protein [Polyangiaceae bacterium]
KTNPPLPASRVINNASVGSLWKESGSYYETNCIPRAGKNPHANVVLSTPHEHPDWLRRTTALR